jgi:hypothetical protein
MTVGADRAPRSLLHDLPFPSQLHNRDCKLNDSACFVKRRRVALLQVPVSIRIRPHQLQHREDGVDSAEVIPENELKFVCAVSQVSN